MRAIDLTYALQTKVIYVPKRQAKTVDFRELSNVQTNLRPRTCSPHIPSHRTSAILELVFPSSKRNVMFRMEPNGLLQALPEALVAALKWSFPYFLRAVIIFY